MNKITGVIELELEQDGICMPVIKTAEKTIDKQLKER